MPWDGFMYYEYYIPTFMKIGTGIEEILRFCFSSFRGCNIDITDGMAL
jgi:hypothetical protein